LSVSFPQRSVFMHPSTTGAVCFFPLPVLIPVL
jgi:hypothetical protein